MRFAESQFSDALDRPFAGTPANTVLLASTPRSGSGLIGQAMEKTGQLGVPHLYASAANAAEWARRLETTTPETTLAELMARRTTPNGVFSIQAHYEHCVVFGSAEKFMDQLPGLKVVHFRRADVLRQAVSFAIAKQTGIWADGTPGPGDAATYDPGLIDHCLNDIAVQNALWVSSFERAGVQVLDVTYENAIKDIAGTVRDIAGFCGVAVDLNGFETIAAPRPAQDHARVEGWIQRYADDRLARRAILRRIGGLARRAWTTSPES